ncbi:hypothetical protein ACFL3J_03260 [Candidatus Omnitrophota bacterium]
MRNQKLIALCLIVLIAFSSVPSYGKAPTLYDMLRKLNKSRITTLQRSEVVDEYMGQVVKGDGRIKDILKSFSKEGEAMVYLDKPFKGKRYEVVVAVSRESAEKLRKGKRIRFEGKFAGISYETLRFEEGTITCKAWWLL